MSDPHHHAPAAALPGLIGVVIAVAALLAATAYLAASTRLRLRGDAWPGRRDACFTAGCAVLVYALLGPLPGGPFTVHMAQHLVLAMIAPVLVVPARPLTLLLRVLAARPRRTLLAVAHSAPATVLVFPPLAAMLDLGGLWLLYRTPLFAGVHHQPLLHAAVHVHVVVSGLLFTFAVCQLDPVRRRWSLAWRATALLAAGAAHAVLAKALYATPPPGTAFTATDLHTGAQLMYYGGDLVELAIAVIIAVQWYTTSGRARTHQQRRAESTTATAPVSSAVPVSTLGQTFALPQWLRRLRIQWEIRDGIQEAFRPRCSGCRAAPDGGSRRGRVGGCCRQSRCQRAGVFGGSHPGTDVCGWMMR